MTRLQTLSASGVRHVLLHGPDIPEFGRKIEVASETADYYLTYFGTFSKKTLRLVSDGRYHIELPEVVNLAYAETLAGGIIKLQSWPEGYVLWFHGEIVWKSWAQK